MCVYKLIALILLSVPLWAQTIPIASIYQDSRNSNDFDCDEDKPVNFPGNCGITVSDNTNDVTTWWSQVSTGANPNGTGEGAIVDTTIAGGDVFIADNLQCTDTDGDPIVYISNAYIFGMVCMGEDATGTIDEDEWECTNIGSREDNASLAMEHKRTIEGTSSQTGTAIAVDSIDVRMTVNESTGEIS